MRSKALVYSRLIAGIVGSNPDNGMEIHLLCEFGVVQEAASATSLSFVQRSPTVCVWVCVSVWSMNLSNESV